MNEAGVGNCSSVGEIGWVRISCREGQKPQTSKAIEMIRMRIPRKTLTRLTLPPRPTRKLCQILF